MNLTDLKAEIANLPRERRRELMSYAVNLSRSERGEFLRKLTTKIDARPPERWMTIEDVEKSSPPSGTV